MNNKLTIFYTDDDQDDIDFFKEIVDLIDVDLDVVTQRSGNELLKALHNPPPHPYLVFLDINIPGMNGFEILKRVRETVNFSKLPVVMFSTSSDELTINKSRELGANYYLPKIGIFDQLKKSIEHTLKINWGTFTPNEKNFVYNYS